MIFLLSILVLLHAPAKAYFEHSTMSGDEMNGISFKDHSDFPQKWKLVTVRFREDSGEIRMTYANEIAFKAMAQLTPSYPTGSKFGKMTFFTSHDPAFPSSKVPIGVSRFQLMVKEPSKYKSTNNWGYALFDEKGRLFKEDLQEKTMACAACHQLVPERDYIFSRSYHHLSSRADPSLSQAKKSGGIIFRPVSVKTLGLSVQELLKSPGEFAESLEGKLKEHSFSGTLDEVIPLLLERLKLTGKPSVLYIDEKNFSLVFVSNDKAQCPPAKSLAARVIIHFNGGTVRDAAFCF